ncbi:GGDEF domain-containing protein [uncultured Deefgea sp.]|uniref:GGDEF domain-containing protein n=1 Tax=uncultured Deefgea sp. TaxID=1304914 RepID=UPI002636DBCE|nr:GGDEF domain-containing protein [uncultured Deefgea sp.]
MLANSSFQYQAAYCNGKIYSYEALLRPNPSLNQSVEEFVAAVADKVEFDLLVIEKVVLDLKSNADLSEIQVSINISADSLESDLFMEKSLPFFLVHKNITLEIMGLNFSCDKDLINININKLKLLGIRFSINNYGVDKGTKLLADLNVDFIKLDGSLVKGIENDYVAFSLLRALYESIVFILNKDVVIQHIENEQQFNLVKQFESVKCQGFFLSKPEALINVKPTEKCVCHIDRVRSERLLHVLDRAIYDLNRSKGEGEVLLSIEKIKLIDKYNILRLDDLPSEYRADYINFNYLAAVANDSDKNHILTSSLINSSDALVIIRDSNGQAVFNNDSHKAYLGMDLVDLPIAEVLEKFPDYKTCIALDRELLDGESAFLISDETIENGDNIILFHTYRQKIISHGQTFVICSVYEDKLKGSIKIDPLTGCFMRSFLDGKEIKNYQSLVFIDLDGFKLVNDSYGHGRGDDVLKDFAQQMSILMRSADALVRFGGDEFVVLFECDDLQKIKDRMNFIRQRIDAYFKQQDLAISFSYGASPIFSDIQQALHTADVDMYIEKASRKS